MKNYFKKNKVSIIVTSAALVSAAASAAYALWQKSRAEEKVLKAKADTIWRLRRVREQQTFSPPVKSDFDRMNGKSCSGIAYQIDIHTYSDSDFGNYSRECAILILNGLTAENLAESKVVLSTPEITVNINRYATDKVRTSVIGGRRCLVIDLDDPRITVNGVNVSI